MMVCIFCGNQAGNEEHIVGKWMLRDLNLYEGKFHLGIGRQSSIGALDQVMQPQRLGSFKTKEVCQKCNNGWMSRLENEAKRLLTPLLDETLPADDRRIFSTLFIHCAVITRWLVKTACTFGTKLSVPVPQNIRAGLLQARLDPAIVADLSINSQSGLYLGMSRQWNVFKDGECRTMELAGRSFRFVWQVRHLAMRVAYFPGCEKRMREPRFPVRLYPKFQIPPDYGEPGNVKRAYHYDTLEQLEHETVYFHKST